MVSKPDDKKQLIIVTGLSGAGKSTSLGLLEDIGFYCVDNIPQQMLWDIMSLFEHMDINKMALGVDARWKKDLSFAVEMIQRFQTKHAQISLQVFYLEAQKDALVNRFALTRRKHPIAENGDTSKAIEKEMVMLAPFKEIADVVLDTSKLNTHQLREKLISFLAGSEDSGTHIITLHLTSFGFKYGIPLNVDYLIDSRFLPNPHYVPEIASMTGMDFEVAQYLEQYSTVHDYLTTLIALFEIALKAYEEEGRWNISISVGCTGGQHRSVYLVQKLAEFYSAKGYRVKSEHRDLHYA